MKKAIMLLLIVVCSVGATGKKPPKPPVEELREFRLYDLDPGDGMFMRLEPEDPSRPFIPIWGEDSGWDRSEWIFIEYPSSGENTEKACFEIAAAVDGSSTTYSGLGHIYYVQRFRCTGKYRTEGWRIMFWIPEPDPDTGVQTYWVDQTLVDNPNLFTYDALEDAYTIDFVDALLRDSEYGTSLGRCTFSMKIQRMPE